MNPKPVFCSLARLLRPVTTAVVVLSITATVGAQIPGRNVNMVSGTEWPGGDPFLQRQNEPSMAASTRNSLHLVAGSNDYRTVDLPGLPDDVETGDAWVSVYKSFDGGQRWASTLMPGYPQDTSAAGMASPLKGYQAAADPVVRAGTSGLIYYNGLVFNRGDNGSSGIFLARFIDKNNKENGDPVEYLGASMVVSSDGATFLDKPWMAVDIPRGNSGYCAVGVAPVSAGADDNNDHGRGGKVKRNGHRKRGRDDDRRRGNQPPDDGNVYVRAGAVYVAYTAITGEGASLQSQIYVKRSMDCGATWSAPMRVTSTADAINQGATLAISPSTGDLFVAWRRFSPPTVTTADAVMVTRLKINANSCDAPGRAWGLRRTGPDHESARIFEHRKKRATPATAASLSQLDQSTSPYKFRTNAYPAMTVDGAGRAYIAWSERGYAPARPSPDDGDARIRVATTLDGKTFTAPVVADSSDALLGHQLMPSLAFAGGKLMLAYYDLRDTRAGVFGPFVDDSLSSPVNKRQTIDIRAALGTPGAVPVFAPSVPVSDYLTGFRDGSSQIEQLQVNPPNLPMFRLGTVPFIGDYIDVSPSPAFVPLAGGGWGYNTAATSQLPVFHAVWTDNRDVRPPLDGNWASYAPPGLGGGGTTSLFDPTQTVEVCRAGNAGSRNQNIYTSRISGGLVVGAPGNAKQLSPTVQRGFVVFAQNQATVTKTFRMTILSQPQGAPLSGRASFEQFPLPPYTATSPAPKTFVDLRVPPRSTASRTVYATSTDPKAQISIDVSEIGAVGGSVVSGGLAGRALLNPDIENPDIENPDIENPDIENPDIENAEVYNPDIENPDIENPDIENPDIENPDIENPDIENVRVANPDIENIGIATPDIENPDIENPDIENPDIENPDIENGVISDVTWTVTNIGNTTSAFNTNMFLASATVPSGISTQLIVYKTYKTPVLAPNGCDLKTETRNILLFNVPSPNFITPGEGLPDQNDPSDTNATLWLNPGEVGRVTLRVYDPNKYDNIIVTNLDGSTASIDPRFNPATVVTSAISAQGVDVLDPVGATEPPAVTTTGTNLFYLEQPTNTAPGAPIAPSVRVRIWDNTGAPLPGVTVSIVLLNPPVGALLSGTTTAVADVDGIATFTTLSVNVAATGLRLRATATSPGAVAAGTSAPFDVAVAGGPVSLWRADSTALDSVGSNHGTLQGGASYTVGRIGPGFNFYNPVALPTPNQFVLVSDAPSLRTTGALTMSAWIYPNGSDRNGALGGIIMNKEWAYEFARFPDGTIRWAFGNGTNTFSVNLAAGSDFGGWFNSGGVAPLNTWTHVAVTYNLGVVTTFINGVQVDSRNMGDVLGAGPSALRIGAREWPLGLLSSDGSSPFNGRIDEVGIQNRALTPAEVQALYNAALPQVPVTVAISNVNAIFDGSPKPVTAVTTPSVPVSVIYNSSTTAPSAIGAYSVQAIVSQNGYVGSTVVTHKIASTLPVGGNGGVPYSVSCAPGVFGLGLRTVYGFGSSYVKGGQLICHDGSYLTFGDVSNPGGSSEITCPGLQNLIGILGRQGTGGLTEIGVRCQLPAGGAITEQVPNLLPVNLFAPVTCPAGLAVTGFVGGVGAAVDSMALVCAPITSLVYTVPAMAGGTANTNCLPGSCDIGTGAGGTAPVNTGVLVNPGSSVTLTATGQVVVGGDNPGPYGPAGTSPYAYWPQWAVLEPSLNQFALVARIGSGPWQLVGNGPTVLSATGPSAAGGVLQLAVNDSGYDDNTGSFAVTVTGGVPPAGGAITSVSPSSGAPGEGFLVVRGTGLPAVAGTAAVVTNGATTANGFIFGGPSTTDAYWVRLPGGFPLGPATIEIQNGASSSNAFPIMVSATPGTPVITGFFSSAISGFNAITLISDYAINVRADGIDTLGSVVRFQQGATIFDVPSGTATSSASLGLVVEVVVPSGVLGFAGPWQVSIRQGGGAFSAPVTIDVVN